MPSPFGSEPKVVLGVLSRTPAAHGRGLVEGSVRRFFVHPGKSSDQVELRHGSLRISVPVGAVSPNASKVMVRVISIEPLQLELRPELSVRGNGIAAVEQNPSEVLTTPRIEISRALSPENPALGQILANVLMATGRSIPANRSDSPFLRMVLRILKRTSGVRDRHLSTWLALEAAERGVDPEPAAADWLSGGEGKDEPRRDRGRGEARQGTKRRADVGGAENVSSLGHFLQRSTLEPTELLQLFNHTRSKDATMHWVVVPVGAALESEDPVRTASGNLFIGLPTHGAEVVGPPTVAVLNVTAQKNDWWFRWDSRIGKLELTATTQGAQSPQVDDELLVRLASSVHTAFREQSPAELMFGALDSAGKGTLDAFG